MTSNDEREAPASHRLARRCHLPRDIEVEKTPGHPARQPAFLSKGLGEAAPFRV
ncbi:hypothetical protein ACLEPN_05145 [Myxococcus sp. 1LA]